MFFSSFFRHSLDKTAFREYNSRKEESYGRQDKQMESKLKERLNHVEPYAEAFWNHEMIDRPYICVTAPLEPPVFHYSQAMCFEAGMREDFDSILVPRAKHVDTVYFGGEAIPTVNISLGANQYAAFFGAKLKGDLNTGTVWSTPCVDDFEGFIPVLDKSENGYYSILKRFYQRAAEVGKDKYLIDVLDMHSNMDALSGLRGAAELCTDLYDCPEEVHRVLEYMVDAFGDIYDMLYEAGNMASRGTIGWAPIYCKGKSAVLSCDFSALLGPKQGNEYVFPAIEAEAAHLDHSVYHLDGKQALVHLDTILSIDGIDCVQWVPGDGEPRTYGWMDVLKKIQAAGKAVWIYDWTADDIKKYHKELQPDKVAYSLRVGSKSEADELLEYLVKNT